MARITGKKQKTTNPQYQQLEDNSHQQKTNYGDRSGNNNQYPHPDFNGVSCAEIRTTQPEIAHGQLSPITIKGFTTIIVLIPTIEC